MTRVSFISSMFQPRSLNAAVPLRLLPLGDSITDGWQSTDDNGYRLDLRLMIDASGIPVDFIGSKSKGKNNSDNYYEAFPAKTINEIHQYIRDDNILAQKPNVVLMHAGTNDVNPATPKEPYASAPDRLGALIDEVLCRCPSTVLMVAQIINDDFAQARVDAFNAAIPRLIDDRRAHGYKIKAVDFSTIGGSLLYDGVHPNDDGYLEMGRVWYYALQGLPGDWITSPDATSNITNAQAMRTCNNAATNGTSAVSSTDPSSSSSNPSLPSSSNTVSLSSSNTISPSSSSTSRSAPSSTSLPSSSSTPSPTQSLAGRGQGSVRQTSLYALLLFFWLLFV